MKSKKLIVYILLLFSFILCIPDIGYRTIFNIFNFPIIKQYGIDQYILNIKNFHVDTTYKVKKGIFNVYNSYSTRPITISKLLIIGTIKKGDEFKLKGYYLGNKFTYLAIKWKEKNKFHYGYIYLNYRRRFNPLFSLFHDEDKYFQRETKSWLWIIIFSLLGLIIAAIFSEILEEIEKEELKEDFEKKISLIVEKTFTKKINIADKIEEIREIINQESRKIKFIPLDLRGVWGTKIDIKNIILQKYLLYNISILLVNREKHKIEEAGEGDDFRGNENIYLYTYSPPSEYKNYTEKPQVYEVTTYRCPTCHGKGEKLCSKCAGNGYIIVTEEEGRYKRRKTCYECNGKGYIDCNRCNTTGKIHIIKYFDTKYTPEFYDIIAYSGNLKKEYLKNKIKDMEFVFEDTIVEKENIEKIIINNIDSFLDKYKEISEKVLEFTNEVIKKSKKGDYCRIGIIIKEKELYEVEYEFNNKKSFLWIDNNTNNLYMPTSKFLLINRISNFIKTVFNLTLTTKKIKKYEKILCKLAATILWRDGKITDEERKFFSVLVNNTLLSKNEKEGLLKQFEREITLEDIKEELKSIKDKEQRYNLARMAWHGIIVDEEIDQQEERLFNELIKILNIDSSQINRIKKEAERNFQTSRRKIDLMFYSIHPTKLALILRILFLPIIILIFPFNMIRKKEVKNEG